MCLQSTSQVAEVEADSAAWSSEKRNNAKEKYKDKETSK